MNVICYVDQSACNFQVLIFTDIDDQIQIALDSNLRSAILCALLCMKSSQFSTEELYMTITNLSYQGAILHGYLHVILYFILLCINQVILE